MLYQSFYAQDDILRENNPSFKISPFLTNKEALTVLCSVVKHAGLAAARTRKKCRGQHEMQSSVTVYFLTQYNRIEVSQDFFICFMNIKNPFIFHTFLFNFQNNLQHFFKAKECRQHVLYSHIYARFFNKSERALYLNFIINAKQKRTDYTYKTSCRYNTSRLVRTALFISAINKELGSNFFSAKLPL